MIEVAVNLLVNLAKIILKKYNGNLKKITKLPQDKARRELLSLPGIGKKTADVFIVYCMNKNTIPIDTNIERVAKRIPLVDKQAKYDEIQKTLKRIFKPKQQKRAHELLIRLGRDFCRARNPKCKLCPLSKICKKKI